MGQFKPMVKMFTDEPKVILKLKKGGKVHSKHEEHHGHKAMHHMHHDEAEHGHSPKKPSMAHRRKAMNPNLYKKGGKVEHEEHEIHKLEKELKHHEHEKASKAHHGLKKGGKVHQKATGGSIDNHMTKTTIKGNAKKFMEDFVVDGDRHDKAHGTKGIKEGSIAGFKHGGHMKHHKSTGGAIPSDTHEKKNMGKSKMHGTIEGNEHDYLETEMHSAKKDKAHGTKGIKETNAGGFKHGGKAHKMYHKATGGAIPAATEKKLKEGHMKQGTVEGGDWEDRPADTATAGKRNGKTGGVKEGNAGGFKRGGHASKKAYATGGIVDTGKAVKMPKHFVSQPVANSLQSGTFKKGGKVQHHQVGGLQFPPDQDMRNVSPQDVADAKQRAKDTEYYERYSKRDPEEYAKYEQYSKPVAGAGRGFVNPPLVKKHGGRAKK